MGFPTPPISRLSPILVATRDVRCANPITRELFTSSTRFRIASASYPSTTSKCRISTTLGKVARSRFHSITSYSMGDGLAGRGGDGFRETLRA
jgi:hypothetical protein